MTAQDLKLGNENTCCTKFSSNDWRPTSSSLTGN